MTKTMASPHPRGVPGRTHCGSWLPVYGERYGWRTRLVCALAPGHGGKHRTRDGWGW